MTTEKPDQKQEIGVVAKWMLDKITATKPLYQEEAAWEIKKEFGDGFIYDNDNGNPAIKPKLLAAFRKISSATIVWVTGEKCWRLRVPTDGLGRKQA